MDSEIRRFLDTTAFTIRVRTKGSFDRSPSFVPSCGLLSASLPQLDLPVDEAEESAGQTYRLLKADTIIVAVNVEVPKWMSIRVCGVAPNLRQAMNEFAASFGLGGIGKSAG